MNSDWKNSRTTVTLSAIACFASLLFLATLAMAAPRGSSIKVTAKLTQPTIIAVRVRHDMCPYCKELDPKFPKFVRQVVDESVLFITIDLTNASTQKQSAMLVSAMGLEKFWTGDMSKMGSITFVDAKSKRELSFTRSVDPREIRAALDKSIDALQRP